MKKAVLCSIILLFLTCTEETGPTLIDVVELIPADNEISGWVREGDMEIAENESQLYQLINGDNEIYLGYGFVKCAFQDFQGDLQGNIVEIQVRAFDMGDTTNARGVYHDYRIESGGEIAWTEAGHAGVEARYETLLSTYTVLEFWDDRFYVDITIDDATPQGLSIVQLFALNISSTIRGTD